jgi:hypothetical protein
LVVHRAAEEMPTLMLAEDLNVTFPLSYWVTEAFASPKTARKGPFQGVDPKPIAVDPTHVIYPLNTEYEIFSVGKKRHTLGAIFILNHKSLFEMGVPPVRPVVKKAREAMLTSVQVFNNPQIEFKSELFIVTNIIAWTYLLHAHYRKRKIEYRRRKPGSKRFQRTKHGAIYHWSLEECLDCGDCPLDDVVKKNLRFPIGSGTRLSIR